MPRITFKPVRQAARVSFQVDGVLPTGVVNGPDGIAWDVRPDWCVIVRLSTGGTLKDVRGNVYMHVEESASKSGKDDGVGWGGLYYSKAYEGFEARYFVDLAVSRILFDKVLRLAEFGRPPTIDVEVVRRDELKLEGERDTSIVYGPDPDGRELRWDNAQHPVLKVDRCRFQVQLGTIVPDETELEQGDDDVAASQWLPPTNRDVIEVRDRIVAVQTSLQQFAGKALFVGWSIVILLAILVFR